MRRTVGEASTSISSCSIKRSVLYPGLAEHAPVHLISAGVFLVYRWKSLCNAITAFSEIERCAGLCIELHGVVI